MIVFTCVTIVTLPVMVVLGELELIGSIEVEYPHRCSAATVHADTI